MRLVLPESGLTAVAELLDADAPRTCAAVWNALPLEGDLLHGIWSGPETYLPIAPQVRADPENLIHQTQAGDIGYYAQPGGRMAGWPDDLAELAFFYGRGARPYMPTGPVSVNLFARIIDNLEGFANACDRIRLEGIRRIRVERADDTLLNQ